MAFKIHCDADGCEAVDSTASGAWLVVHETDDDGCIGIHEAPLHFCSFGCLAAWAMAQAIDQGETEARAEG